MRALLDRAHTLSSEPGFEEPEEEDEDFQGFEEQDVFEEDFESTDEEEGGEGGEGGAIGMGGVDERKEREMRREEKGMKKVGPSLLPCRFSEHQALPKGWSTD